MALGVLWVAALMVLAYGIHSAKSGGRIRFKATCTTLGLSAEGELETRP